MHSRLLVSGLPRSLPPLPPSPAPPCLPFVEGLQHAALHSSSFPPSTTPLQTLHMDVWGPTRVSGQGRERYFLLVVDDYTRYTTVFPLRSKGGVSDVLILWICTDHLQLRERFGQDLPFQRLHSDRDGEFSSDLLRDFCHREGILQSFTLLDYPQQYGIAEHRIGLVMEVTRTSMIHAAAPHFLWPFAVRFTTPPRAVTFDESVPFYRLFPYRSAAPPPPPLFLAPGPPPVDPLPPQGPAPSGVSQVDPLPGIAPIQVAVGSGAAPDASVWGAASGGAASGGVEPGGAGSEGPGSGGAEPGGAETEGAESRGAEPRGAALPGGPSGASPRLTSQQLREWLVQRTHRRSGAPGARGAGDTGAGGAAVTTGAGGTGGTSATAPGGARTNGAGGAGSGGVGCAGAGDPREPGSSWPWRRWSWSAGDTVRPRPYFVPLLQQVFGVPSSIGLPPPNLCPPPDQSQPPLQPASPLPAPSPYTEQFGGLTEHCEPESRPILRVRTARLVPRPRPPPVPGTHTMALRPSSVPLRVPLPAPPESSPPDTACDRARAASPTVARLLATAVTDPSFESAAASALVAELLKFAAVCHLDYASALVAESEDFDCLAAAVPRFASMLLAPEGDSDAPDIPTARSYTEAITSPYSSQWQAAMDAEMASWKSTGTYVDAVPLSRANIVDGMWIFRVKRPSGFQPAFKARYVAQGFSQQQGVDYFQTFSPTPKMTTLRVLLHVAAQRSYCDYNKRDYELHSLDFSTAFLQGSLHEEIWLRRPPGLTGTFPAEPLGAVSTMAGPEERSGRVSGGSGGAQAQGQPRDSAMAPMQPSLGPPRDEPRVFGLDKFNGDNFAEWSFKMENIFHHYDLLEVMEGMEKRPEIDPEKSPWVRKSAQGYLLLGQALGSSQIRHIKPFQCEPEKGPKAWAALKGVHAPATAAVAVVLERQMAALRIEEDEAVEEGLQKFFDLLTRLEGADLNYSELQKKTKLLALLPESWSSLIINLKRDLPHLSLEDVKRAILQEDFRRRELASADGAGAASIGRGYGRGKGRGRGGSRLGSNNFNGGRGSGGYGGDNKSYGRGRGRFDGECHYCHKSGHMWRDCFKLPDGWTPAQGQEGTGAGGGRGRGRGGRGGRGGGAASMKSTGNESESRDDRFTGQFFFVSTQASAGPEKDEGCEEPAAVEKVTLHSLDYWVIDSGATYSMTPRADLLTELEPSPVKHVTSALGQRAEVKGMGKAMFKGADGKMVGLKNVLWVPNLAANLISVRRLQKAGVDTSSKGAKTYTARLGERLLWDLHEDRDVYNEMWQIPVVPMPKERVSSASGSERHIQNRGKLEHRCGRKTLAACL
ncbi:unnamed protein product [Closterium sp. NIES-53]